MEERVLVWASKRDAALTCGFLAEAGFTSQPCVSASDLDYEITRGVGAVIAAGELLVDQGAMDLGAGLARQPPWSDIPVIVVAGDNGGRGWLAQLYENLGTVSVLHRPLSLDTLASTVRAALHARRRQYQLRDLLKQREEADRRREEFLAMLAHELRNPLAPIRTGLQLLRLADSKDLTDQTQAMIERQVNNLSRLIDDLLDVSRITRGKIILKKQIVDVPAVVRQVADSHLRIAAEKGLAMEVDVPATPLHVSADPTRLEQMIGNLLTNAIKFTPVRGHVRLSAALENGSAVIRVQDSGIGIPPHMLQQVFDQFAQADRPLDRGQGGLGIGLTVVKSLTEMHGGSVDAFSKGEGEGSEFVLRLPAITLREEKPLSGDAHRGLAGLRQSRRILLVEDNRDAADALATYLRANGHTVFTAYDGIAGMNAALRERPDVIICDIGLPGLDGYELARSLRSDPRLQRCLMVAVTGYGDAKDRARGLEAGFQHYLTKPADPEQLIRLVTLV